VTTDTDAVRARIDLDEIDYPGLARDLGPDALPALREIAQDPNPTLASKAVYLASEIAGEEAAAILRQAGEHPEPALRVAAAAGLRNLDERQAEPTVDALLQDDDPGVRKVALRSAARMRSPRLHARVEEIADRDPDPAVRSAARDALP
jgi:HEAT repeat protein